ncbi:MAG: ATP-dependent helicase [Lachnospiraceae bacterium]|nr:ATP-dependent helicase [Lachnospiraceae bacterium]
MKFSEAQKEALFHKDGPMMVLAGPGSGKTTVITHRILRLLEQGVSPSGILVITFTKAAAMEMKERFYMLVSESGRAEGAAGAVSFGTFHSVFYQILKLAYRFPPGSVLPEEEKRAFFQEYLNSSELDVDDEGEFITSLISEISYVKGGRIDLNCYYSQNCPEEWFKKLYGGYEDMLRRTGKIDFDDMLLMCHELFTERKDILSAWQKKYKYILVDEFQDINRLQYEIVQMLALPENNLFIVGDDDQSIYRFRGAKPEIMLGFMKDYPAAKRVLLAENYRSSREIVEASMHLISHNRVRYEKALVPVGGAGRPVDAAVYENPLKEMDAVARKIRMYAEAGYEYRDMAILFRMGSSSGLLSEKLMEYNVPFVLRDGIPNLYSHWIAKDILAYLALGEGSRKRSDFLRIMNRPNRYLSREAFETPEVSFDALRAFYRDRDWMEERIMDLESDLRTIPRLKPAAAVNYVRKTVGYDDYLKEYAKFRKIRPEELLEVADRLSESASAFSETVEWFEHINRYEETMRKKRLEEQRVRGAGTRENGVTLSTMHSAKGLEYRIVFVIDANEGIMPHHRAALPADVEEERRLFYVAMTRAKERLHIMAVRERYHKKQELSRFVRECADDAGSMGCASTAASGK